MDAPGLLHRLTELTGIERSYWDIWGNRRAISDEGIRRLLSAMGIATNSPEEMETSVQRLETAEWRRPLPPAHFVRADDASVRIPVTVPSSHANDVLQWMLIWESGACEQGECRISELEWLESRDCDGQPMERRLIALGRALAAGYHRFEVEAPFLGVGVPTGTALIAAPEKCFLPPAVRDGGRVWGFTTQLYGLQSDRNWGMGDFSDLRALARGAAELGANAIGLNPLHALFANNPAHHSPYSPSSRLFLNVLYIDVEALPEFAECEVAKQAVRSRLFQRGLEALREMAFVDYVGVAKRKLRILELLYDTFCTRHLSGESGAEGSARGTAFHHYTAARGADLERMAVFEALSERFATTAAPWTPWQAWPEMYRDPGSEAVRRFAERARRRVDFFKFLQWVAEEQLAAAAAACEEAGMALGLIGDLAVGVNGHGADAWGSQAVLATGAAVGAPPDAFAPQGQDWGFPPFNPLALRDAEYEPFITMLRANMRHYGALRIDHVLGFLRFFWIPPDTPASDGTYVRFPLDDLLALLALESHRNRCMVIGEDLGTVPEGLRERLHDANVLSCRLLYFERQPDGSFVAPEAYPHLAQVSATTHDLPTLPGFWTDHDIEVNARLGRYPSAEVERQVRDGRAADRQRLLYMLRDRGLVSADITIGDRPRPEMTAMFVEGAYRYLAQSNGCLLMVQFEDVLEVQDQANLPGTTDEHPNWKRKLPRSLPAVLEDLRTTRLAAALRGERPPSGA